MESRNYHLKSTNLRLRRYISTSRKFWNLCNSIYSRWNHVGWNFELTSRSILEEIFNTNLISSFKSCNGSNFTIKFNSYPCIISIRSLSVRTNNLVSKRKCNRGITYSNFSIFGNSKRFGLLHIRTHFNSCTHFKCKIFKRK